MNIQKILVLFGLLFFCFSCGDDFGRFDNCEKVRGTGTITSRTLELNADISEIDLNIPAEFVITSGTTQEIIIEGHPNVLDLIESESSVIGNKWKIFNTDKFCVDSDETKIEVRLINFSSFELDGVADVKSEGVLDNISESLRLDIDGAGKIELDFTSNKNIDIDVDGAGEIGLNGETENSVIKVDGASDIKLHGLVATNCDVNINGAANVEVNVTTDLSIDIDGAGRVCYLGSPTVTSKIDGVGRVKDCN